MTQQFAIIDDRGQQFGLPAREFNSKEAAEEALDFLRGRRRAWEQDAAQALEELTTSENMNSSRRQELEDRIRRWDVERDRSYQVMRREVTPWTPL